MSICLLLLRTTVLFLVNRSIIIDTTFYSLLQYIDSYLKNGIIDYEKRYEPNIITKCRKHMKVNLKYSKIHQLEIVSSILGSFNEFNPWIS